MVKPNELMIGNWVTNGLEPFQVTEICGTAVNIDYGEHEVNGWIHYLEDVEPIPLTPEILEKCGFASIDDEGELYAHDDTHVCLSKGDDGYYLSDIYGQPYSMNQKYLHQLQNLHYCLRDKELIYKP